MWQAVPHARDKAGVQGRGDLKGSGPALWHPGSSPRHREQQHEARPRALGARWLWSRWAEAGVKGAEAARRGGQNPDRRRRRGCRRTGPDRSFYSECFRSW